MASPTTPLPSFLEVGRRIGIAGLAALVGGVLVLGVGGRVAMRISGAFAIASDPTTRFMLTGDGFRIGRLSLDGTIGLVLFGGLFGAIVAGAYWALFKEVVPHRRRFMWAGVAATAIGGNHLVHPDNIDFVILHPIALNVVMYPVLAGVAGMAIVAVDRWLTRRCFGSGPLGAGLLTALGLTGGTMILMLGVSAIGEAPVLLIELGALGLAVVPIWVGMISRWEVPAWIFPAARVVAVAVIGVEWVRLVNAGWLILGPGSN